MVINQNTRKKVVPVASGKGGVGKTILAANIALELAANGKNTVLVDLDLGGSNLHTVLGLKNTNLGIGNYLASDDIPFEDIVTRTPYDNLRIICGDALVSGMADVGFSKARGLLNEIVDIESDYILLDLGSGSSCHVLDNFLISNSGILVVSNQKTSIANTYGFLKNLVYRFLHRVFTSNRLVIQSLREAFRASDGGSPVPDFLTEMKELDREVAGKVRKYLSTLKPLFVVNRTRSPEDLDTVKRLAGLIRRDFNVTVECLGAVFDERDIDRTVSESQPFLMGAGESMAARQIARMTQKIVQSENFPDMPLELDQYEDSFALARIEAANDFEEWQREISSDAEAREREEVLTNEDLIGVIREQQAKIQDLKGTLRMLTLRKDMQ
jgi:flagellar biosynthesis protein FlhG